MVPGYEENRTEKQKQAELNFPECSNRFCRRDRFTSALKSSYKEIICLMSNFFFLLMIIETFLCLLTEKGYVIT